MSNAALFRGFEESIKNGYVDNFDILWKRIHEDYPKDIFGLLIEYLGRGVKADAIAAMIRIVKKTEKPPVKLVKSFGEVLDALAEDV